MRDGVVVLDAAGRIEDVNQAASRLLGRPRPALVGASLAAVVPALDSDQLTAHPERSIEVVFGEGPAARHYLAHLDPVRGAGRSADGWLLRLTDISERKRAETALQESERRYRTVVDGLSEIIFQTDASRRLTLLNPAWTALTGYEIAETLGTWIQDYIHPDDRLRDEQEAGGLLDGARELSRYELRFLRLDGDVHWLEVHARPSRPPTAPSSASPARSWT